MERLTVIVPFSRPTFMQNVLNNFASQTYLNKRLIIVENNKGKGTFEKSSDYTLLSSDPHQAYAKNEAIAWMNKHGGGWWAAMDDDDYYGPEYLSEIAQNLNNGDVIGKRARFFGDENHTYLTLGPENQQTSCVMGLVARAEDSCELKPFSYEDMLFSTDMIAKGAKVYATSRYNFIHKRHKGVANSWGSSSELIAQCEINSGYEVIQWNHCSLDMVNGKEEIKGYTTVQKDYSLFLKSIPGIDSKYINSKWEEI